MLGSKRGYQLTNSKFVTTMTMTGATVGNPNRDSCFRRRLSTRWISRRVSSLVIGGGILKQGGTPAVLLSSLIAVMPKDAQIVGMPGSRLLAPQWIGFFHAGSCGSLCRECRLAMVVSDA